MRRPAAPAAASPDPRGRSRSHLATPLQQQPLWTTTNVISGRLPLLLLCMLLSLCLPGAAADSHQRNPLRSIAVVENAEMHAPSHRVHALSSFQISLDLRSDDGKTASRIPLRLRLSPNHDILADNAVLRQHHADGSVTEEPIRRLDHRVFRGDVFVRGTGRPDDSPDDNHWRNAGWAAVYVHADGDQPVFEGAFQLHGNHHHIQSARHFLDTRVPGDPLLPAGALVDPDTAMVVWRDSDILPDGALADVETVRELRRRWQQGKNGSGNSDSDSADSGSRSLFGAVQQPACSADSLAFNTNDQPAEAERGLRSWIRPGLHAASSSWLLGRQIDGSGQTSGNSAGVNLSSTIGNTAGCPTSRKVALMGIAADCNYVAAFASKANASDNIVAQVNSASRVYESTFNVSLAIKSLVMQDANCPSSSGSTATPWNGACDSDLTISSRLNLFSEWRGRAENQNTTQNTTDAFWMLLTTCPTGSAVGLAWKGQLCVSGAQTNATTNESVAATNVVVRTSTEWQVMAHETGHTFGAVHDCTSQTCSDGTVAQQQCCPLSATECDANGQFLMNPSTGSGITQFSACTIGNVCSALGRHSVNSTCLTANKGITTITGSLCGNGIVEAGEDCDCGGTAGCGGNACCDPTTCRFTTNSLCDPANDDCCSDSCQLAAAGTVCRPSTGFCNPAETCTGASATCPADVNRPDGTACTDGETAGASNLACASGQCTSRNLQCQLLVGAQTSAGNDTYACSDQGCQISCASPEYGANTCLMMMQNFLDGTPCQGGGRCANGNCEGASVGKEIASAVKKNLDIIVPVAAVVGAVVLAALVYCLASSLCRRQRRRQRLAQMRPKNGSMPMQAGIAMATLGRGGQREMFPKPDHGFSPGPGPRSGPEPAAAAALGRRPASVLRRSPPEPGPPPTSFWGWMGGGRAGGDVDQVPPRPGPPGPPVYGAQPPPYSRSPGPAGSGPAWRFA